LNGILFDIEHNDFWWNPWGARPTALETAIAVATQRFEDFPRLTPVYAHRYLLSSPLRPGNPVFSVHKTDIIYYGADLPRYFAAEFDGMPHAEAIAGADPVPFWGELS
jgi:hypothetical protein